MSGASSDDRLLGILETCYREIEGGRRPDLDALCGADAALKRRVEGLLARESELWASPARPEQPARRVPLSTAPVRLGDFTIVEPLGSGGMSKVFRARQESLGRDVALKILRDELVATEVGRLRFQREASITAALDHPNIVPVYAAGEVDGVVFLAMKLLRGQPLDKVPRPISYRTVAGFGLAIARALQSAHDIGVVHRDIKPANIVIEAGVAYVVDFGLSSFSHSAGAITQPDSTPGTLMYLAPELARRQGNGLDPRVDVYGLGATLYEAVAGQPPFAAGNPIRLLHAILHQDPKPLRLTGSDADLETIILRAMEKEPSRRFQSASELAAELERYLAGIPIRSRRIGWIERGTRLARRRPLPAAMLGVICMLVVGMLVMHWQETEARRQRHERGVGKVVAAIQECDFVAAESALRELAATDDGAGRIAELRRLLEFDRDVVVLTAILQSPITHQDAKLIASLAARLAGDPVRVEGSMRADAALAFSSRLLDPDPVAHRPLLATTRTAWPRTAAAIGAWSRGASVASALAPLTADSDAFDHLFAALALRFSGEPAEIVESELRAADAQGPGADAVQYSLAWTLEAAGQLPTVQSRVARLLAAYDVSSRLCERPAYGALAEFHCARLAALLKKPKWSRKHLEAGISGARATPLLVDVCKLYELEVLLEIDVPGFWSRWRELEPDLGHLPQYWLRAGYASSGLAAEDAGSEALARAKSYFERGLQSAPTATVRASLELALLQLDASVQFSAADSSGQVATERWLELAQRAESFAANGAVGQARGMLRSDALSVASLAWFQAGHPERGWRVLETAARDHGDPAVLCRYAAMVAERILAVHMPAGTELAPFDPARPDGDAEHAAPLPEAASRALEWAVSVIDTAASMGGIDADALREARIGAFACAFHLGEPTRSLPLALEWQAAMAAVDDDKVLQPLIDCCIADGGFRAEQWLPTTGAVTPRLATMLSASVATMRSLHERKQLTGEQVATALARWRRSGPVAATAGENAEPWRSLWRDIAALEAQLRAAK